MAAQRRPSAGVLPRASFLGASTAVGQKLPLEFVTQEAWPIFPRAEQLFFFFFQWWLIVIESFPCLSVAD